MAVITNLHHLSKNPKTGVMSQLWILPKNETPWMAIKHEGGDDGICGDCIYAPLRAWRARDEGHDIKACYVGRKAFQAPSQVWRSVVDKPVEQAAGLAAIERSKLPVRFGAYGDPAMLPDKLVALIHAAAIAGLAGQKHTAYTHQSHRKWAQWIRGIAMASVNNEVDGKLYRSLGWRTFRIGTMPDQDEILCPNYTHGTQCIKCGLCNGSTGKNDTRKSIVIPAH